MDENKQDNSLPNKKSYDIDIINFNNYVIPEVKVSIGTKYVLNDDNNSFFKFVEDRYNGSTTNSAIIDKYVYYIIGDGLIDKKGEVDINKYISEEDINLICLDFKMHGQYSLQVIWSQGSEELGVEKKPIRFKWLPTSSIGLNVDKLGEIDGYWYSFDWSNRTRYKPKFYPKFDGTYKDAEIEILTVCRVSQKPYFPFPDYKAGLQYAVIEEENSNGLYNAVNSGFAGLTVINCRGGIPATEELRRETTNKLEDKVTGSNNQARLVVSYSDSIETGHNNIDVQNFETLDLDKKLDWGSKEAMSKLFMAHKVSNPILFGAPNPSGFGNNAEEMVAAKKEVYSSNINPMRKEIIRGLKFLFKYAEPNIDLEFEDFEELRATDATKNNPE